MKANLLITGALTALVVAAAPAGPYDSIALNVAPDGSAVVGRSAVSGEGEEAFLWTPAGGMVDLGDLPGGAYWSSGQGVSAGGSVVVGVGSLEPGTSTRHAVRWTEAGGMVDLGDLPGGADYSAAYSVSADGNVVVGGSDSGPAEAFRWTADDGMVGLGALPGYAHSSAGNVSMDGSVVIGVSETGDGWERQAFRWTESGGMLGLGDLPGGFFPVESMAYGVSADGSVVVGYSESSIGDEAFRWTESTGMVGLGDLPGSYVNAIAFEANGDGSLIVGYGTTDLGEEAFIWDDEHGMRNFRTVLESEYALDLTGWQLNGARGISDDGRVIVGYGTNPSGHTEAWVAYIPEPHALLLILTAAAACHLGRHRVNPGGASSTLR